MIARRHLCRRGNLGKGHPEFISGYLYVDAETRFSMAGLNCNKAYSGSQGIVVWLDKSGSMSF
ncbi:hypothetical protein [Rickettsia endosymbiont of Orchestes rusci]|uniref:hypothetical protein n=1 Tax=Rickettsia endosymbiont of Orchestes rusci TaxID=3066250 RepID=UPI00313D5A91